MDYELKHDYMGAPSAKFSMGHEALGRWFTEELSNDVNLIDKILDSISIIENKGAFEQTFCGKNFELTIELGQVSVRALSLESSSEEELNDDLDFLTKS